MASRRTASSASPEATLALLLVGTSARRAATEADIGTLTTRVDYSRLARLLRSQSLLALVGARLQALVGDRLPGLLRAAVRSEIELMRRRGMTHAALTLRWASKLEAAGIPCLPLKGPLLARRIYGDFGLRSSRDVDLLVGPARLEEAVALVRQDGFAAPSDKLSRAGLPERHYRLDDPKGGLPRVELHWRIHCYEKSFSRDVLRRSTLDPSGARTARPADELAALLLFYARDGLAGLRLASDLAAWWDSFGGTLPPNALQPIADGYPELRYALATAAEVADRLVGVPAESLLDRAPAMRRRSRVAARLANWNMAGSLAQKRTNYYLADWLLSPPGGGSAALRRQLFRQPRPLTGGALAVDQVRRALRPPTRLFRSAVGLWRVRGERTFSPPVSAVDARCASRQP